MMALAVENSGLHERIALKVLLVIGTKASFVMLAFMLVTAFLSMWISNTATTAMMIPIVEAVAVCLDPDVRLPQHGIFFSLQNLFFAVEKR